MSSTAGPRLPPGSEGLPLVGETLSFAKNPFGFIDDRLATHGRVFRSRILGRKTVVLAGADAAGLFIDAGIVMREGSMPPHVQELFGGRSLPLLDGDVHAARKRAVLQGFSREALASYLPAIQAIVERYLRAWSDEAEVRWLDEMKRLSIEVICSTVIGMPPGEEMDRLRRDYGVLTGAFAALPIRAPGTRYSKALRARDRILETLLGRIREKRRIPGDEGLSRILAADPSLTDDEAALELHHIVIAGFIVYAELGEMARRLTENPDVRERLAEEIRAASPSGELKPEKLARMPYLLEVVNEVKRLCPIVPGGFRKSAQGVRFRRRFGSGGLDGDVGPAAEPRRSRRLHRSGEIRPGPFFARESRGQASRTCVRAAGRRAGLGAPLPGTRLRDAFHGGLRGRSAARVFVGAPAAEPRDRFPQDATRAAGRSASGDPPKRRADVASGRPALP